MKTKEEIEACKIEPVKAKVNTNLNACIETPEKTQPAVK